MGRVVDPLKVACNPMDQSLKAAQAVGGKPRSAGDVKSLKHMEDAANP
jgi:hypothetical protein